MSITFFQDIMNNEKQKIHTFTKMEQANVFA